MPLYEFKCENCKKLSMRVLPITSKMYETKCDFCGKTTKRIISKTNFQLKGGGWASSGYSKGEK